MAFPVSEARGKARSFDGDSDISAGTYTILTQIGADAIGLPFEAVTARIVGSTGS
jgi:xanthine dehydrogenase YagR molybdenum-binding subunit